MTSTRTTAVPGSPAAAPMRRVLVVEDDLTSREYLRLALGKVGFAVATADGVSSAQEHLLADGFDVFDCVVTDYRMPGQSGLDLLAWLRKEAPTLATIILTAEGERKLVTESLRGGAADFLEKPVNLKELRDSVAKAIELTDRRRRSSQVESAVRDLGRAQQWMINSRKTAAVELEICFHPMLEAGGDFFSHFQPAPDSYFCLLTDVSGHDLKAAYVSAYFQGIVRGMLERGAAVPEIFATFNRFLVEEWNEANSSGGNPVVATTSIAACSIFLDFKSKTAGVMTSGIPTSLLGGPDGRAQTAGECGGSPLGWFPDYAALGASHSIAAGGSFLLWTDGLEDLAERQGVTPLSLGFALQAARAEGLKLPELDQAADDILFAAVHLPAGGELLPFRPLVLKPYRGSQFNAVDQEVMLWSRSLSLAVPEISEAALHDVLLAAREALLNALKHGCRQCDTREATFQISYDPTRHTLRVWVEDPGSGHSFDAEEHERAAGSQLVDAHRGLMLMKHLSSDMTVERKGATVIMDFELDRPEPPMNSIAVPVWPQHNPANEHVAKY